MIIILAQAYLKPFVRQRPCFKPGVHEPTVIAPGQVVEIKSIRPVLWRGQREVGSPDVGHPVPDADPFGLLLLQRNSHRALEHSHFLATRCIEHLHRCSDWKPKEQELVPKSPRY